MDRARTDTGDLRPGVRLPLLLLGMLSLAVNAHRQITVTQRAVMGIVEKKALERLGKPNRN